MQIVVEVVVVAVVVVVVVVVGVLAVAADKAYVTASLAVGRPDVSGRFCQSAQGG